MEKFRLISMTDFILEQSKLTGYDISDYDWIIRVVNYAKFLKQPLKLGMFVPCDEKNEPLDELIHNINLTTMSEEWNKAKEKVLFEGFEIIKEGGNTIVKHNETNVWLTWTKRFIEDLIRINPILTKNATKQFL